MQIIGEAIEALLPDDSIFFDPIGDLLERGGLEAAGAPLSFAAAGDEAGALEDFEVLGDGGHAHVEGGGEFGDGGFAGDEAGEDGAAGGIGESGEGGAEMIGGHGAEPRA